MFARPRSFSILYGIQRTLLSIFYLISVVTVFWLIFFLLHDVLQTGGTVLILVSIVYLVFIVLGYSIIHVISYIPSNLAGAFDPLKNGIADKSIESSTDFAGKLAEFMCVFFNFAFFDIQHAMVSIQGQELVSSSGLAMEIADLESGKLEEFAGSIKDTAYYGKIKTDSGAHHLYIIPIIFGERRLGFIGLTTQQKLWRIFIHLLNEFENDFVDDQVVHILNRESDTIS